MRQAEGGAPKRTASSAYAQQYLLDDVAGTPFYEPTEEGAEAAIKARMKDRRKD